MKPMFIHKQKKWATIWIPPQPNCFLNVNVSKLRNLFLPLITFPEMAWIDINTGRACEEALKMATNFAAQAANRKNPKGGQKGEYLTDEKNHKVIQVYEHPKSPVIEILANADGVPLIFIPRMELDLASANQARAVVGQAVQDAEQMRQRAAHS